VVQKIVQVIPVRNERETKVIKKEKRMRVAAYCRVSTELEEQQSSYKLQVEYYTSYIQNNSDWIFAGIYADEGITGTNLKKRDGFNKLIKDCLLGKIDMVITKSVSRFARNTLDCLATIRKLKEKNIAVFFEKENINTLDGSGEMLLTILSSLAQEESRSLSTNTKWGIMKRFEKGEVQLNYTRFLGYTKNNEGQLVIEPEEAEVVKLIYRLFLEGYSAQGIATELETRGIKTVTGKTKWNACVISSILKNEKYMGDALLQKSYTVDFLTKKRVKNNGNVKQYYVTNNHEGIIPKDIFYRVQEELARRSSLIRKNGKQKDKSKYSSKYILTDMMYCSECGQPYRRVTWYKNGEREIVWRCMSRLKNGKNNCEHSPTIKEYALQNAIMNVIKRTLERRDTVNEIVFNNVKKVLLSSQNEDIEKEIKEVREKIMELVELNIKAGSQDRSFEEEYKKWSGKLKELQTKRDEIEKNNRRIEDVSKFMNLGEVQIDGFDEELVKNLIKEIKIISKYKIAVQLSTGESKEEQIEY